MERFGFGLVGDSDHGSRVYAQPFPEFVDRVDAAMRSFCVGPAPVGRTGCSLSASSSSPDSFLTFGRVPTGFGPDAVK